MTAQPIETEYAGHRFRSRLEARWAVFFDALKLAWQYESQGWELTGVRYFQDKAYLMPETLEEHVVELERWRDAGGTGPHPGWSAEPFAVRYLPDFRLDALMNGLSNKPLHIEVKGEMTRHDVLKLLGFAAQVGPVMLLRDIPPADVGGPHFHLFQRGAGSTRGRVYLHRVSLFSVRPGLLSVEPFGWSKAAPVDVYPPDAVVLNSVFEYVTEPGFYAYERSGAVRIPANIANAFDAARQARFEHGESGPRRAFQRSPGDPS